MTVSPACLACLGRAFATKAMLFSCLQGQSLDCALHSFYISAHKKTSPALLSRRQKKSRILCIFSFGVRKNYGTIQPVGWLVGCKNYAKFLYFCNLFPFCALFLSKIYIPILPQSGVIVKRKIFRGFGRIFGCVSPFSLVIPLSLPCIFS